MALAAGKGCVRFHYVVRGSAWLGVDGSDEPDVALSGGDLAVLPLGHAHVLRDHSGSALVRFDDVARCDAHSAVMQLEVGAKGPETNLVTACFMLDDPLARQILAVLPPVIRMTPEVEQGGPSFLENIRFITREVETNGPGSEIVLLRMADVIFIQILRAYLARVPEDGGGFLGALRDPSTAAALGAMHHRAEAPWTVASLAEEVGLSRSVFAALHGARRGATARLPDASPHAEGVDAAARGGDAREGLAPDGLRVGGLVQPRVPPVGRRRAWRVAEEGRGGGAAGPVSPRPKWPFDGSGGDMRVPARIGLAVGLFGLLLGCGADDSGAARRPDQGSTDASMADAAPDASSDPPGGPCARFGPGDSGEQGIGGGSSSLDDASTADTGPRAHAPFKDIDHACGPNGQCVQGPYCTPGGCVGESQYACVYEGNGTQHCWAQDGALVCGPNPPDGG